MSDSIVDDSGIQSTGMDTLDPEDHERGHVTGEPLSMSAPLPYVHSIAPSETGGHPASDAERRLTLQRFESMAVHRKAEETIHELEALLADLKGGPHPTQPPPTATSAAPERGHHGGVALKPGMVPPPLRPHPPAAAAPNSGQSGPLPFRKAGPAHPSTAASAAATAAMEAFRALAAAKHPEAHSKFMQARADQGQAG